MKKILIGGICGIAIISIVIVVFLISKNNYNDTYKIAKEVSRLFDDVAVFDEGADNDYKYSYLESAVIYIGEVLKEDGNFAIEIAKYNSAEETAIKVDYLKKVYTLYHEKIDGTLLEKVNNIEENFNGEEDLIYADGVYLIRINSYYKNRYDELKNKIENILNKYGNEGNNVDEDEIIKYWDNQLDNISKQIDGVYEEFVNNVKKIFLESIEEMENCKGNECEEYLNTLLEYKDYTELANEIEQAQSKYNEIINKKEAIVSEINSLITKVENSLNKEEYDSIKTRIEGLDDTYYDEYMTTWNNKLNAIDEKVYKNSCNSYSYKDVLRNPDDYEGKNAYWFGVISQKVSSTQYRVGVDCTKYKYIDGYSCDNTIYVFYYGNQNLIEDDVIKLWGTMDGTVTYTAVLGNSITIPSFNAKYITLQ